MGLRWAVQTRGRRGLLTHGKCVNAGCACTKGWRRKSGQPPQKKPLQATVRSTAQIVLQPTTHAGCQPNEEPAATTGMLATYRLSVYNACGLPLSKGGPQLQRPLLSSCNACESLAPRGVGSYNGHACKRLAVRTACRLPSPRGVRHGNWHAVVTMRWPERAFARRFCIATHRTLSGSNSVV